MSFSQEPACGNAVCESGTGEDYGTCNADCETPKIVEVTILSPTPNQSFVRGDKVIVQAKFNADSVRDSIAHQATALGKFGMIDLFDDGRHDDAADGDHIYGNSFLIGDEYQQQTYKIAVTGTVAQTTNSASVEYNVTPFLAISFSTDKTNYVQGEEISLQGIVSKKDRGLQSDINLEILFGTDVLFKDTLSTDALGRFDLNYQITTLSPDGEWTIKLRVRDQNGNYGFYEKKIMIAKPQAFSSLKINYLTQDTEVHKTGEQLIFEVEVVDAFNQKVEGAIVTIIPPLSHQKEQTLQQTPTKTYAGLYKIPYDLTVGQQPFELRAVKTSGNTTLSGSHPFILHIEKSLLTVFIIEPTKTQFQIGEQVPLKVKIAYADNQPLQNAILRTEINQKPVDLKPTEAGVYEGTYTVTEDDPNKIELSILAKDQFQNIGETKIELYVRGKTWDYFLVKNQAILLVLAVVAVVGGFFAVQHLRKTKDTKKLFAQKMHFENLREDLQKRYYVEKMISRETYDKDRIQIETKLEKINSELEKQKGTETP
ncbi:MAG: hypothetical protein J4215_00480 [Candidatus Diapherotrites archaeon]|uniref:Uncharacterized protein n=1 Tax=Candidatus Iainarchaeum sp. TaxID=3101447 RepID=A0A8T4L127_9ARCH|nr:hypothetical protein [Candidatus Diapherotrites archaeon]